MNKRKGITCQPYRQLTISGFNVSAISPVDHIRVFFCLFFKYSNLETITWERTANPFFLLGFFFLTPFKEQNSLCPYIWLVLNFQTTETHPMLISHLHQITDQQQKITLPLSLTCIWFVDNRNSPSAAIWFAPDQLTQCCYLICTRSLTNNKNLPCPCLWLVSDLQTTEIHPVLISDLPTTETYPALISDSYLIDTCASCHQELHHLKVVAVDGVG